MTLFVLIFMLLVLAALGLAVGGLWSRPLPGGSCREAYLAAGLLPRCEGCAVLDASSPPAGDSAGGAGDGHRA